MSVLGYAPEKYMAKPRNVALFKAVQNLHEYPHLRKTAVIRLVELLSRRQK